MKEIVLFLSLASQAVAAPVCAPRDVIQRVLVDRYGETPRVAGLTPDGALMEVYGSEAGSWSVTVTAPDASQTCVIGAGVALMILPQPKTGSLN
jgi:adenine deaminase